MTHTLKPAPAQAGDTWAVLSRLPGPGPRRGRPPLPADIAELFDVAALDDDELPAAAPCHRPEEPDHA